MVSCWAEGGRRNGGMHALKSGSLVYFRALVGFSTASGASGSTPLACWASTTVVESELATVSKRRRELFHRPRDTMCHTFRPINLRVDPGYGVVLATSSPSASAARAA